VVCGVCVVCDIIIKINKASLHKQHYTLLLVLEKESVCSEEWTKYINMVMNNGNVSRSSSSQYYCYEEKKMAAMAWNLQTKE
jgi:hypothetical protein